MGYNSIPDLVNGADVVVTGEVISFEPSIGTKSGSIVLLPAEILKGEPGNAPLTLSYDGLGMSNGQAVVGRQVLAFVRRNPSTGGYSLFPLEVGGQPTLDRQLLFATSGMIVPASLEKTPNDTPLQKVIKEIAVIHLNSTSANSTQYLLPLAWSRVEPELTAVVFRAILKSSRADAFLQGTAGLVCLGDLEGLQILDTADIRANPELASDFRDLEIFSSRLPPQGVAILFRWLQANQPPEKRHAAAGALAQIHTPEAILSLGPELYDSDFEVRWRAIGGMSMFANNVPIGGMGPAPGDWPFRTENTARLSIFSGDGVKKDEQRYLQFWRQWWSENEAAVRNLAASRR